MIQNYYKIIEFTNDGVVRCIELNLTFPTCTAAGKYFNVSHSAISAYCRSKTKKLKDILLNIQINNYYDGSDILTEHNKSSDYYRISPSSVAKFFSHPRQWWGETVLKESGFEGSSSTILGTIVHHCANLAANKQPITSVAASVADYLDRQTIEFDAELVSSLWQDMSNTLITEYVNKTKFHSTEQFIYQQILPGIYAAGTYDALRPLGNGTYSVVDYKTAAIKPSGLPYHYRMQAHVYAYILTKNGLPVSQIELQYVTQPTKTLPCRHFSFIEPFTQDDFDKIESQLTTIAKSLELYKTQPELLWALAQDYRLKQKIHRLFKD